MMTDKNNPNFYKLRQYKDKELVLENIRELVKKGSKCSIKELKQMYSEQQLFYVGLKYVTTTKKAFCKALDIPVEAGCRYKRTYEKVGLLKESVKNTICPYTKDLAKVLSTNPNEFSKLTRTNQLKLF